MMPGPLSTNVSKSEKVLVVPVVESFDEHADICAINWFDLKIPWLYQLYGLIASRFVRKVSGKLYFKGKLIRRIEGPDGLGRDNLLIMCYPGARKFLDLVDFKIFQVISVLRLAAVQKFVFGFTRNLLEKSAPTGAGDVRFNTGQVYLVHHFRGGANWLGDNRQALFSAAQHYHMPVYFCGLTNAHIAREKSGQRQSPDFFMDGMLLFAANSETDIENLIRDDQYVAFMRDNNENSLYLFSRTH